VLASKVYFCFWVLTSAVHAPIALFAARLLAGQQAPHAHSCEMSHNCLAACPILTLPSVWFQAGHLPAPMLCQVVLSICHMHLRVSQCTDAAIFIGCV
jgi:hypothetical protein